MRYLLLVLFVLFMTCDAYADLTVCWDKNVDADYYVVYWGSTTNDYQQNSVDLDSNTTSYTIVAPEDAIIYTAIKAFNSCGNSSPFSKEMCNKIPADMTGYKTCFMDNSVDETN